ncbi:MAG: cytochrome oxidase Cu insertion factor (SCO1/SenC/PrrC family) [Alteromonadaceae bacterium]|jgi:cytochrome oxidase Cu insertion factor (SCO1/SenC/PrrC family)
MADKSPAKLPGFLLIAATLLIALSIPLLPLKMDRRIDWLPLDTIASHYALLYFGYPGCDSACPITLSTLTHVYHQYTDDLPNASQSNLSIVFVNLIDNAPHEQSQRYASNFHPDFIALAFTRDEMIQAKNLFGLKFSPHQEDGQLFHKGSTYLLQKTIQGWRLKRVYSQADSQLILAHLQDLNSQTDSKVP